MSAGARASDPSVWPASCNSQIIMMKNVPTKQHVDPGEALGRVAGLGLAPFALVGAALRDARLFHPRGRVYRAEAVLPLESIGAPEPVERLAARLVGPSIVRTSSGFWKNRREWPDVLGLALRFGWSTGQAAADEQDLLFGSTSSLWKLPYAALATDVHDYLNNQYFAASSYVLRGVGRVTLSLLPAHVREHAGTREEKLDAAVAEGGARLHLWLRLPDGRPFPVVDVVLREPMSLDQEQLRFSPFSAGRGLDPAGFVHGLRWATYAASRLGERVRASAAAPAHAVRHLHARR
jgi:hypothetical protein